MRHLSTAALAFAGSVAIVAGCSRARESSGAAPTIPTAAPVVSAGPPRPSGIVMPERAPSPEALARKARSETRLRAEKVKVLDTLPSIETASETTLRSKEAIAERALALSFIAEQAVGDPAKRAPVSEAMKRLLSPKELAFMNDPSPSEPGRRALSWRVEAAYVLLWALGYVPRLAPPTTPVTDANRWTSRGAARLIAEAKPRSLAEVLDEADLIYRYDWACVDAHLSATEPSGLHCGVVFERHYALNWLIQYMGQAWDDVSTDT